MTAKKTGKKLTLRRCIGCFEFKEKKDLIRLYKNETGHIEADVTLKAGGRGAYICPDPECFKKAEKRKALEHSFKMRIPKEDYETLMYQVDGCHDTGLRTVVTREEL